MKFLFAGGSQAQVFSEGSDFEFCQNLGYKLIEAKVEGSGITPRQIVEDTLGKHGARYDEASDMVMLDNVCKTCVKAREVEQFLNFYDTEKKMTLAHLDQYEDVDFDDSLK